MTNANPVGWFEIYVDDMDRAKKFYTAVFGYEITDAPPMPGGGNMQMAFLPMVPDAANASGALVKMDDMKPGTGGTLVYFSCGDCSIEESRVEAAGGKVCQAKMSIGEWGFISIISDSEGNTIGLHSMN